MVMGLSPTYHIGKCGESYSDYEMAQAFLSDLFEKQS